jgi:ZIP family zinc transporter
VAVGYAVLFAAGLAVGLLTLVYYESWMAGHSSGALTSAAVPSPRGPGAMGAGEVGARRPCRIATRSAARRISLLIAVGIGLHNFAAGLAVGQSARQRGTGLGSATGHRLRSEQRDLRLRYRCPLAGDIDPRENTRRPSWGLLLATSATGAAPPSREPWWGTVHQRGR